MNGDVTYAPTNREKAREPKPGFTWCSNWDGCLCGDGKKCRACGTLNSSMRKRRAPRT